MNEKSIPVWPRLDYSQAEAEFDRLLTIGPDEACEMVNLVVDSVRFYETAIHTVDSHKLSDLRAKTIDLAERYGFPGHRHSGGSSTFDQELAVLFESEVPMLEVEASLSSVWHFMTLRVLPDVAIWRWPGDDPKSRAEDDGVRLRTHRLKEIRRNLFRQAWYRQNLLGSDACRILNEDAFVQLTDRMTLLGNRALNHAITQETLRYWKRPGFNREVLRFALRLVGQACGRIAVESIGEEAREQVVSECFDRALRERGTPDVRVKTEPRFGEYDSAAPDLIVVREGGSPEENRITETRSAVEERFLELSGRYRQELAPILGACDFKTVSVLLDESSAALRSRTMSLRSNRLERSLSSLVDVWPTLSAGEQSVVASTLRFSVRSIEGFSGDKAGVLEGAEAVFRAANLALGMVHSGRHTT
ncbi:hypothetical protein [Brevibacterium sp. ZH18]|uniref:hypothetical protein n=1 Tax=Brevibacterium sp. ZH18 TaxID=2927784 RepID=UPI001F6261CA|nr:hypothetical protein [Brevibacterium sp. ZH18]MCI4013008.1 hypothetical protein [Brevibacterium sp. ZH18]